MVLDHELTFFVKHETKCKNCCTENEINGRLELLIDNIEFGGYIVQQNIGIRMGTTCALLISDRFLYSYEANFIQKLIRQTNYGRCSLYSLFRVCWWSCFS